MPDGTFVNAIKELVEPTIIDIGEVKYDVKRGAVVNLPHAAALSCTTLAAMRDYMAGNPDSLEASSVLAHIMGPDHVVLLSNLEKDYRRREAFVQSKVVAGRFQFGQFLDAEDFIVQLQTLFVDYGDRAKILQVVGNISDTTVRTIDDDGVTQTVNTKVGVTQRAEMKVPNPVILMPYRTFPDVNQPASKFVFRMTPGRGENVNCALFEADNAAWRVEAMANIRSWLVSNLPTGVTVLS